MKKALITGITGMVGSHLADFLLENTNWNIYGVCRWRSPLDNVSHLLERVNQEDRVFFEYADLNDEMSLITVVNKIKPDYVLISAGQPNIKNGNVYGHPHVQTLMNYLAAGVDKNKIFWTYPNGSITLETDGQNIEVKPTKNISWIDFYLLEKSGTININF